jgi:hypothetical protein
MAALVTALITAFSPGNLLPHLRLQIFFICCKAQPPYAVPIEYAVIMVLIRHGSSDTFIMTGQQSADKSII